MKGAVRGRMGRVSCRRVPDKSLFDLQGGEEQGNRKAVKKEKMHVERGTLLSSDDGI